MSREIVASKLCIDLKLYRKIYSSVDSLYAWLYNETKEKNCLFDEALDRSQNISLHFICITFHLHYITFAFKNRATSARNA